MLAHIAGWQVLRVYVPPIYATLALLGVDLVIAAIFGILAARSSPSRDEHEALTIRQRALREARESLALGALIPVAGALPSVSAPSGGIVLAAAQIARH